MSHALITTYGLSDLFELPIILVVCGLVTVAALTVDMRPKRPRR